MRTIYWNLVAIEESMKISQELLRISEKQVKESRKRLQSRVADKGEVARYQSQVAARKGNLNFFKFQKSQQLQALQEILPTIAGQEINLVAYDLKEQ